MTRKTYCGNLQSTVVIKSDPVGSEVKGSIAEGSASPGRARVGRRQLFLSSGSDPKFFLNIISLSRIYLLGDGDLRRN